MRRRDDAKRERSSFATISSGLYRILAITVLLDVKDISQVGPLQWGRIIAIQLPRPAKLSVGGWADVARLRSMAARAVGLRISAHCGLTATGGPEFGRHHDVRSWPQ
jgi:hypothetical protein